MMLGIEIDSSLHLSLKANRSTYWEIKDVIQDPMITTHGSTLETAITSLGRNCA